MNGLAALYSPIQDCDEVFNFWEPTHYISHGYGLQTWEYSPVYSIRSWLYVSLHAAIGKLGSLIVPTKAAELYFIRCGLAVFCAACQTRLYSSICRTLNPRIGLLFILIALFSPGIFHASTAFLPSTFTMYTGMLGLSAFLDLRDSHKTAQGIMWFGLGSIVGWPFAGALMVPLLLEELILSVISHKLWPFVVSVVDGGLRCLAILVSLAQGLRIHKSWLIQQLSAGSRGSSRLRLLPKNRPGALEYRRIQHIWRAGQRARDFWC